MISLARLLQRAISPLSIPLPEDRSGATEKVTLFLPETEKCIPGARCLRRQPRS
jgi:hypothetical protein